MVHYRNKIGAKSAIIRNLFVVVIVAIALARDVYYDVQVGCGFSAGAFLLPPATIPKITSVTNKNGVFDDEKASLSPPPSTRTTNTNTNTILFMAPANNKNKKDNNENDTDTKGSSIFWENLKDKPGTLIILPFVALVGIDLLLNIAVITKRSIDYFVFGQAPSTEPWW